MRAYFRGGYPGDALFLSAGMELGWSGNVRT